jgi:polyisoprenoid-binding protein YceI
MFDEASPSESNVQVTIDMDSLDSNIPDLDDHLKGGDFFAVDQHSEARFKSTAVRAAGEDRYEVDGDLTLHGHTEPVTLDVTINKIGMHPMTEAKTIGFDATTAVSRSAFGLGMYTPAVGDEVQIRISSEMPRESDL